MTRWERLLDALGVTPSLFEIEHASKFDLSPETWVRERIEALQQPSDDDDEEPEGCDQPCCVETSK